MKCRTPFCECKRLNPAKSVLKKRLGGKVFRETGQSSRVIWLSRIVLLDTIQTRINGFAKHFCLADFGQDDDESSNIGLGENVSDTEPEIDDVDPDGLEGFSNDGSSDYADQDSSDEETKNTIDHEDFFCPHGLGC